MGTAEAAAKNRAKVKNPGRKKGSKNKFTNLKQSFLDAYQAEDGFGGDEALKKYAKENQDTFLQMIKSMLPKELEHSGKDGKDLIGNVSITLVGGHEKE